MSLSVPWPPLGGGGEGKAGKQEVAHDLPFQLRHKGQLRDVIGGHPDLLDEGNDVGAVGVIGALPEGPEHQGNNVLIVLLGLGPDGDVVSHGFSFPDWGQ